MNKNVVLTEKEFNLMAVMFHAISVILQFMKTSTVLKFQGQSFKAIQLNNYQQLNEHHLLWNLSIITCFLCNTFQFIIHDYSSIFHSTLHSS
jgi:hypothetical protein